MATGLKEIREASGLKIGDVSRATCICSRYLKAIEEEDFPKIPADVYTRGYIKEYANYLGVPFSEAFKGYESYLENNRSGDNCECVTRRKTFLQLLSSIFLSS